MNEEIRQATPKKCAMYARSRMSGDPSVQARIAQCCSAARDLGWEVAENHEFSDTGCNQRIEERPGLMALLAAARSESCAFNVVIVDKLSTFSRKIADILRIYSTLSRVGVTVHVINPSLKRQPPKIGRKKRANKLQLSQVSG